MTWPASPDGTSLLMYLKMRSLALSEMGTSGGKTRVSFQFITFL